MKILLQVICNFSNLCSPVLLTEETKDFKGKPTILEIFDLISEIFGPARLIMP